MIVDLVMGMGVWVWVGEWIDVSHLSCVCACWSHLDVPGEPSDGVV